MDEQLKKLQEILKEVEDIYIRLDHSDIKAEHDLINDLGLDSLGRVSLFHEISYTYNLELEDNLSHAWKTVSDILIFMKDHCGQ